ncbi:alpha-tubulin N-acetyltransferase 1-like [Rhinoraja longicauda]
MEPLCVLDFFVHVSLQRHGYGKELFDYMIQYEGVQPHHLAIDRPSSKFLSFLRKHYRLAATIPQVNNFVVFDSFFRDRQLRGARLIHRSAPKKVEQDIKPYSITVRDGAPREQELPWPFNQSPSLTRSNSLGRASRQEAGRPPSQQEGPRHVRGALNGRREQEDPSAHRTRTSAPCEVEDVVAARSLGAVHTPTPPSPEHGPHTASQPLPHQNLSGQSQPPVFRGPDPCSGDSSPPPRPVPRLDLKALPGYPGSPEKRPSTSASLHDPPPAPRGRHGPGPGPGPERRGGDAVPAARSPGKQLGVPGPWPAVMEMELPTQAQWIRHKNKFRNTRPW